MMSFGYYGETKRYKDFMNNPLLAKYPVEHKDLHTDNPNLGTELGIGRISMRFCNLRSLLVTFISRRRLQY